MNKCKVEMPMLCISEHDSYKDRELKKIHNEYHCSVKSYLDKKIELYSLYAMPRVLISTGEVSYTFPENVQMLLTQIDEIIKHYESLCINKSHNIHQRFG